MSPVYRLWLEDKVMLSEFRTLTIDDVEDANRVLDARDAALAKGRR